jgi:hypothetical protein
MNRASRQRLKRRRGARTSTLPVRSGPIAGTGKLAASSKKKT